MRWDSPDHRAELDAVFGHFQNLNLLVLIQDLRAGRTARQAWRSVDSFLCPIAHGMPEGVHVQTLQALGQTAELPVGCQYAARCMGADPDAVLQFVRCWDAEALSNDSLLHALEEIWRVRLADAEVMQELLQEDQAACNHPRSARRRVNLTTH